MLKEPDTINPYYFLSQFEEFSCSALLCSDLRTHPKKAKPPYGCAKSKPIKHRRVGSRAVLIYQHSHPPLDLNQTDVVTHFI